MSGSKQPHNVTTKTTDTETAVGHREKLFAHTAKRISHSLPDIPRKSCAAPAWWPERCAQRPDPISNSAVKRTSAHGTVSQDTGESVAARPAQHKTTHSPSRHNHRDTETPPHTRRLPNSTRPAQKPADPQTGAGWSSPVARQAHNLKVAGSNPAPATKTTENSPISPRGESRKTAHEAGRDTPTPPQGPAPSQTHPHASTKPAGDLAPWIALVLKLGSVAEETDDEEEPVQRGADHRHPGRSSRPGYRSLRSAVATASATRRSTRGARVSAAWRSLTRVA